MQILTNIFQKNTLLISLAAATLIRFSFFLKIASYGPLGDEKEYLACIDNFSIFTNPFALCSDAAIPYFNYYPYILLVKLFGVPELLAIRSWVFILGTLTIILVAKILNSKNNGSQLVKAIVLLTLGTNPSFIHFSIFGWFNQLTIVFVLLLYFSYLKLAKKFTYSYLIISSLLIALSFQAYLIGRVIALVFIILLILTIRGFSKRAIFLLTISIFLFPFIATSLTQKFTGFHRMYSVIIYPQELNLLRDQLLPAVGGLLGIPYTIHKGPDNPNYVPSSTGILPPYVAPLVWIALISIIYNIVKHTKYLTISFSQIYFALIYVSSIGVNLLTYYPLNVSRSLLIVVINSFLIKEGIQKVSPFLKSRFTIFLFYSVIVLGMLITLAIYNDWLNSEFKYHAYPRRE